MIRCGLHDSRGLWDLDAGEANGGIAFIAIAFATVPSLMIAIGASRKETPVGVMTVCVILVVAPPIGVAVRGTGPNGDMPSLAGARWADVQEAMGCSAWAAFSEP